MFIILLFNFFSEGKTYDLSGVGGPSDYTYGKNEPLDCLQSDAERGWFNDKFLQYKNPSDIPMDQENLPIMALDKDRYYFIIASYTGEDWVNAPAMWECYKKANKIYEKEGLSDHLVVHFHKEGHAVIEEDMKLLIDYFDHMYLGTELNADFDTLKTTAFFGQEAGNALRLRLRPYKSADSRIIVEWLKDGAVKDLTDSRSLPRCWTINTPGITETVRSRIISILSWHLTRAVWSGILSCDIQTVISETCV